MARRGLSPFSVAVLLLAIAICDCYADDLLGILGFSTVNLIDYSQVQASVYLAVWTVLLAMQILLMLWIWRSSGAAGRTRVLGLVLILCSSVLMVTNHAVRLWLTVLKPVHELEEVPARFFVESYIERLLIYMLLCATATICLLMAYRSCRNWRARVSMMCILAASAIVFSSLLLSGLQTLRESEFWTGGSIMHGPVYMGSIPRGLALAFEPYLTYLFLVAFGFLLSEFLRGGSRPEVYRSPLPALFMAVFVQGLPKINRGLLTEAISTMDFHYTFHHDRSIAFPCLGVMILLLAWLASRVPASEAERCKAGSSKSDLGVGARPR